MPPTTKRSGPSSARDGRHRRGRRPVSPPAAYPPVNASGGCGETRARSLHRCFHPTGPPARVGPVERRRKAPAWMPASETIPSTCPRSAVPRSEAARWPGRVLRVRLVRSTPKTAGPSALPIWRRALLAAPAVGARRGGRLFTAMVVMGAVARAMPMPSMPMTAAEEATPVDASKVVTRRAPMPPVTRPTTRTRPGVVRTMRRPTSGPRTTVQPLRAMRRGRG